MATDEQNQMACRIYSAMYDNLCYSRQKTVDNLLKCEDKNGIKNN
jgi:hypothetical protein